MNVAALSVAQRSVELGRNYVAEKNFGRAFSHYLVTLTLKPNWKSMLEDEFIGVLCEWGLKLEQKKRFSDVFVCYKQAIDIFPTNEIILNNYGAHLLRCHLFKEANYYFKKCLKLKPNFLGAIQNLENLMNLAVERWHFRMLNDYHRNDSFRKAILKKIQQGFDTVLDIGTGTGLLSLFCAEGKAKEVYACDSSEVMVEIARKVFISNNVENVKLLNKHSTELMIPLDIPRRVSLVVTETLDSGLLGEGILSTLSHAWKNLLLPPEMSVRSAVIPGKNGFVIPSAAQIYITGIQSDSILKRFYTNATKALFPKENTNYSFILNSCDGYDTEDLTLIDFRYLTNIEKILRINFNDPNSIENILKGNLDCVIKLKCIDSGRLDCFAMWFDLVLDEDTIINTGPQSETNIAWEQAVFPLPDIFDVEKNQEIPIRMYFKDNKLCIDRVEGLGAIGLRASETLVKRLNDLDFMEVLTQTREKLVNAFDEPIHIMDWFPFPILGFTFLKARLNKFRDKLTCFVSSEIDRIVVNIFAKKYGLEERVIVEVDTNIDNYLCYEKKFDLIVLDLIEATGEIKKKCVTNLKHIRKLLKPSGIILPEEVAVVGQFVNSNWFNRSSQVVDQQRTCGFNVGEFINPYQVRHFIDFSNGIEKTDVGQPIDLFYISEKEISYEFDVLNPSDSLFFNAMIYWFKIKFIKDSKEICTNKKTSSFNLSAFLFPNIGFEKHDKLKCRVLASDGLFSVQLLIINSNASDIIK